jgi:hypothetical protein
MMGTKGELLMDTAKGKLVALQIRTFFLFVLYNVTYVKRLMLCTGSGHKFEYHSGNGYYLLMLRTKCMRNL